MTHEIFKTGKTDRLSATDKRKISYVVPINLLKRKTKYFFCTFINEKRRIFGRIVEK